ncbi:chromosome partition protein Smc [Arenivirga flava]|uniref:Chromosome partition protein Smc n=1 Tax=Arenivirga flava TaxID=1930060 RepID=A0AA37XAP1_9MICO|nr:chromosome partition protein Smc [Arenivirga flava]
MTLKGFKSFARPTTFAFEPGVTCVVGPNGSGKSNVVDGLAWVMGEQGAKTLRGGKMEDVIFAGTSSRGPLGRAEVTLTIDNADGALPIEYSEVTIRRTLFRNGGSEYAINGETCRLLDVQELLSDSGLGREMHVIVGQGQLDSVLQATPEERRGFIEEAAGILKHRRRKEKTVRKLEAMQTNFTRLNDLAGELRRQLKPLGQQAEIAREAASIAAIVRDARARLLADEVVELRSALDAFTRDDSERRSERIVLQEQLDRHKLREQRLEQAMVGDEVDEARRVAFGLESVQERLRGLHTLANQRLALLGGQDEAPDAGVTVTQDAIDAERAEIASIDEAIEDAERRLREAQSGTLRARSALDALDEQISAQSALVSQHDLALSKLSGQADTAASRLAAVRGEVLRQQHALDAALLRRESAEREFEQLEVQSAPEEAGDLDQAYQHAQSAVADAESRAAELRERLHGLERERDALESRRSALSLAFGAKDGSNDLVRADLPGIRGLVADHVQVRPGFEAAVAAALGTLADAVLADDRDAAIAAVERAGEQDWGRVELVLAATGRPRLAGPALPAGTTAASDVVTAPDGVHGILARTVIADDLAAARTAWEGLPAGEGWTFITLGGDVLTEYALRGGSGAERSRLELAAERDAAAAGLDAVLGQLIRAEEELEQQRAVTRAAKERSSAAYVELREFDAQLAAHSQQLSRGRARLEAAQAESDRLGRSLELATEQVQEAEAAHERARGELETQRAAPRPILDVSERDGLSAELEQAREAEVEARLQLETARERSRAQQARVEQLVRQRATERAAAEEAARRAVIRRRQLQAAEGVVAALPAVLAATDRSVTEARVALAARETERSARNEELQALRREEAGLRERLAAVQESVHGLELQIYERRLQLSALLERAGSELGLVEQVLVAEYGPEQPVPDDQRLGESAEAAAQAQARQRAERALALEEAGEDGDDAEASETEPWTIRPEPSEKPGRPFVRDEQRARLRDAERKLARLGRVNPLALEEFAALEQRHAFLSEQLTDLVNTRKDLLTIIEELDERMRTVFESAFADTQAAFDRVFPILFPGGTGSLQLTNPDDMLLTGIEVAVRPAGKKIERLSLLSGGERSLAAVALMVSIFKARPSPFYIMDEVEAALDDANLGRLLSIFEDLRASSQLIVITHQKRTMEIADALYGVSMRQDGVSAVVGQRVEGRSTVEVEAEGVTTGAVTV